MSINEINVDLCASMINALAERVVFWGIPNLKKLEKRQNQLCQYTLDTIEARLYIANNQLITVSKVFSDIFGIEIPVMANLTADQVSKAFSDFNEIATSTFLSIKNPFKRRYKMHKLYLRLKEKFLEIGNFNYSTDPYNELKRIIKFIKDLYLKNFNEFNSELYEKLCTNEADMNEAELFLLDTLSQIPNENLDQMWLEGKRSEVIKMCVTIILNYRSHINNVQISQINKIEYSGKYNCDSNQGKIITVENGNILSYPAIFDDDEESEDDEI